MSGYIPRRPRTTGAPEHNWPDSLVIPDGPWMQDVWVPARVGTTRTGRSGATCAVPKCDRPAVLEDSNKPGWKNGYALCKPHYNRWERENYGDVEMFGHKTAVIPIRGYDRTHRRAKSTLNLGLLSASLATEFRYVIGTQVTEGRWVPTPYQVSALKRLIDFCDGTNLDSILDVTYEAWLMKLRNYGHNLGLAPSTIENSFMAVGRAVYTTLERAAGDPWEGDIWILRDIVDTNEPGRLNWSSIEPEWLRTALKDKARSEITRGVTAPSTVNSWIRAAKCFSRWLDGRPLQPEQLTRAEFNTFVEEAPGKVSQATRNIRMFASLLHVLSSGMGGPLPLPQTTYLRRGELKERKQLNPNPYPPDIVESVEALLLPADTDILKSTERRLLMLLRYGGPRPSEAVALPIDSLRSTPSGRYWIEYHQEKTEQLRKFPIPDKLGLELKQQIDDVLATYGEAATIMFPNERRSVPLNGQWAGITHPWSYGGFSSQIKKAFEATGIERSSVTGQPVTGSTLHRWRHTIGTELINSGWSQYELQQFLGHTSPTMTQAYAKLYDSTLEDKYRTVFEKTIDHNGNDHTPADPSVERMRERLEQSVLPNGFCDLPTQQSCEFRPNPCLECSFFRTSSEWLPVHIRQRDQLVQLVDDATDAGNSRIVEINTPTIERLDTIITNLSEPSIEDAS